MVRPSAASAGKQLMMPSAARMFGSHHPTLLSLRRKREQEQELESDQELGAALRCPDESKQDPVVDPGTYPMTSPSAPANRRPNRFRL